MKEIWEIPTPKWTLPILAEWSTNQYARVTPGAGVPLLDIQVKAVSDLIIKHGWEAHGELFINPSELEKIGRKSQKRNPEEIVVWNPKRLTIKDPADKTNEDDMEFFETFCESGHMKNVDEIKVFWGVACKHMLNWMAVDGRTVNLQFAKMFMVPYRPNWKSLIFQHLKFRRPEKLSGDPIAQEDWIKNALKPELLFHSSKKDTILHSIEVHPSNWFWTTVLNLEQTRRQQHGDRYWFAVYERMKAVLTDAFNAFISYLQAIRHPIPFVSFSGDNGAAGLPEGWSPVECDMDKVLESSHVPDAIDRKTGGVQERCLERMAAEEEGVQDVPDI